MALPRNHPDSYLDTESPAVTNDAKPTALYFRFPAKEDLNPIRHLQEREILDRLEAFFHVIMIQEDCDYREQVDRFRPAIVVFESGKAYPHRRIKVSHAKSERTIPKVMLLLCDTFCYTRAIVLADVESLDIDACFTYDPVYTEYLSPIRDRLFFLPHSFNPNLFRDYGLPKTHDVTLFGKFLSHRRWRVEVAEKLRGAFMCTFVPHDTSRAGADSTRMIFGEAYARLVNSSRFVPADGTISMFAVRKFFEVPACRSCLVTEPNPTLAEHGLMDLVNCVIATPEDVVAKLDYVLGEPGLYDSIVDEAMTLAHSRHTHKQRSQIYDWLQARLRYGQGVPILQRGIYGGFERAGSVDPPPPKLAPLRSRVFLNHGVECLKLFEIQAADQAFSRCLAFIPAGYFSEPLFYLGVCRLLQGKPMEALYLLNRNYIDYLIDRGATAPDPLEAAFSILAYVCLGKREEATALAGEYRELGGDILTWTRRLVARLNEQSWPARPEGRPERTLSLYAGLAGMSHGEWLNLVTAIGTSNQAEALVRACDELVRDEASIQQRQRMESL